MRIVAICFVLLIPVLALGDDPGMSPSIQDVKKQNEAQLLKMAGVVSVGIGLDSKGNQAIIVGLDGSHPETESSIPATLDGFPVVVQTVGSIRAQ
ncbi:MAG: hypothetical protein JRF36_15260 [Deltaproteobacteria bacterium]|jgi:hypothetical protein|nr:hypothetical protein [Deltaproteobacteria bacterium]MBW2516498.1 hypothetical protein [Deltaproteobacteria bacterium]